MSKPDLLKAYFDHSGTAYYDNGKGHTRIGVIPPEIPETQRQLLRRVGGEFGANAPLDVASPDTGWSVSGDTMSIRTDLEFLTHVQVYRNGQLLVPGPGYDVYFLGPDTLGFEFSIRPQETLQIWKNFTQ